MAHVDSVCARRVVISAFEPQAFILIAAVCLIGAIEGDAIGNTQVSLSRKIVTQLPLCRSPKPCLEGRKRPTLWHIEPSRLRAPSFFVESYLRNANWSGHAVGNDETDVLHGGEGNLVSNRAGGRNIGGVVFETIDVGPRMR